MSFEILTKGHEKVSASLPRKCSGGSSYRHCPHCRQRRTSSRRRYIRRDIEIIAVSHTTTLRRIAHTRNRTSLIADQPGSARRGGSGTVTFTAVFYTDVAVCVSRGGKEPGLGGGDAELNRHGVVGGDLLHGFGVQGLGVATGVCEALGCADGAGA